MAARRRPTLGTDAVRSFAQSRTNRQRCVPIVRPRWPNCPGREPRWAAPFPRLKIFTPAHFIFSASWRSEKRKIWIFVICKIRFYFLLFFGWRKIRIFVVWKQQAPLAYPHWIFFLPPARTMQGGVEQAPPTEAFRQASNSILVQCVAPCGALWAAGSTHCSFPWNGDSPVVQGCWWWWWRSDDVGV